MRTISFSSNWNGKLCNDVFTTIRLYNYEKYPDFEKFEVELKGRGKLGIAELEAKKGFTAKSLNDITSLVDCGHSRDYLLKLLKSFYPDMTGETTFYLLVFKWVERLPEPTERLFKERYEKLAEAFQPQSQQPELF
jgi:hypothetical protein